MKNLKYIACILFFVCGTAGLYSKNKKVTSVPFELAGSYVVVRVSINNSTPLRLILDTGVRSTIINELMEGDELSLSDFRTDTTNIQGLGNSADLQAYRSFRNEIKIGKITFINKTVLLLFENVFNFTSFTGKKINGILGADVLQDYIVEINYQTSYVNFYKHGTYIPPKSYTSVPSVSENYKIYLFPNIVDADNKVQKVKMLIDTGAELGAWLMNNKRNPISVPRKKVYGYIGEGLNGEILGHYAHINSLCIGSYCITNPLITFPDSIYIKDFIQDSDRDGTLGNQVMKRFNCVFDFKTPAVYLKPNGMFKEKFRYNIAGIEIQRELPFMLQTKVNKVWKNSTADIEGVKEGDYIIEVNGVKAFQMGIDEIREIFTMSRRFPLHIVLQREQEYIDVDLNMNAKL